MKFNGKFYQAEYEKAEFSHSGDLGDIIWGTAAIRLWLETRQMPMATLYLYDQPGRTTHPMTAERAASIGSLLDAQPWLKTTWSEVPVMSDLNGFRDHWRDGATIASSHLNAIGLGVGCHTAAVERRWLEVPAPMMPLPEEWQVVFARTQRYRSHDFQWADIIDWFGHRAVFLGHDFERNDFVKDFPRAASIPHIEAENMLQAAQVIDHARLFVSNQTSLFAIAEALKKPRVLESYAPCRNCEYGSRNCLALSPGMRTTPQRIIELLDSPFTV